MYKFLSVLLCLLTAAAVYCGQIEIFSLDFNHGFQAGRIAGQGVCPGGKWKTAGENFFIVSNPVKSASEVLKIMRDGQGGYFAAIPDKPIPGGHNYTVEFDCLVPSSAGCVIFLQSPAGLMGGVLVSPGNPLKAYNLAASWENCGRDIIVPGDVWLKVKVEFFVNEQFYRVSMISPDGRTYTGTTEHPFLKKSTLNEVRFINILPQKSFSFADNLKIYCDDTLSLSRRSSWKQQAVCRTPAIAAMLAGKRQAAVKDQQIMEFDFANPIELSSIVLYGKNLPQSFTVELLNSLGHWSRPAPVCQMGRNYLLADFPEQHMITKIRMVVSGPGQLSGMDFLSPVARPQAELDKEWEAKLAAEFDLPVYDSLYAGCDVAVLDYINHSGEILNVKLTLLDRLNNIPGGTFTFNAAPGRGSYEIDLTKLPDGEYLTEVRDNSKPEGGRLLRLLRKRTSERAVLTHVPEMSGEKMFFPDDYYLDAHSNIRFASGNAEIHQVYSGGANDDSFVTWGDQIGIDSSGNLAVNLHTLNRLWQNASAKHYHASAKWDDLDNWTVAEGFTKLTRVDPFAASIPDAARPDWERKKGADGKISYRFYDPEKDGPINLSQLKCEFIHPAAPGSSGYDAYEWGVIRPSANHIWTVWYRSPGEALIVGHKPLLSGIPVPGALEPVDAGSDLHFGQYLSDDGKTLFFGFGRQLIRYLPHQAEYDNAFDRNRIVGILRTVDGINWEKNFIAVPDKSKPVADQHYGGNAFRIANGNGLRMAFLNRYSAGNQQINPEVIFSWDGFNWCRFQSGEPFLAPGGIDSFYRGGFYTGAAACEKDGKIYHLISNAGKAFHFQAELVHSRSAAVSHIDGEYLKKMFSPRKLEKWPFFKTHFGSSWDRLAEDLQKISTSTAIMVYRKDGFFKAEADVVPGKMVTKKIKASGKMKINAVIKDGGWIKIRLLDGENNPIDGCEKELTPADRMDYEVFGALPEGEFKVELELKNSALYTLIF